MANVLYEDQEINTCKNCSYWDDGVCNMPKWLDGADTVDTGRAALIAQAHDDSGLFVHLVTSPTFGCIAHTKDS